MTSIELRGFYLLLGMLLALLLLSRSYRGVIAKEKPSKVLSFQEAAS